MCCFVYQTFRIESLSFRESRQLSDIRYLDLFVAFFLGAWYTKKWARWLDFVVLVSCLENGLKIGLSNHVLFVKGENFRSQNEDLVRAVLGQFFWFIWLHKLGYFNYVGNTKLWPCSGLKIGTANWRIRRQISATPVPKIWFKNWQQKQSQN